jgi:hypothetical protein
MMNPRKVKDDVDVWQKLKLRVICVHPSNRERENETREKFSGPMLFLLKTSQNQSKTQKKRLPRAICLRNFVERFENTWFKVKFELIVPICQISIKFETNESENGSDFVFVHLNDDRFFCHCHCKQNYITFNVNKTSYRNNILF